MGAFVPITGAVTGSTVYVAGKLVARDASVNLPEVTPLTADLKATGNLTEVIWELIENMEFSFNKAGIDLGFKKAIVPGLNTIEVRFTQNQTDAQGNTKTIMSKAFLTVKSNIFPGLGVEVGSVSEGEPAYTVYRYQLFIDNEEAILVDKLAGIVRMGGQDMTSGLSGL